MYRGTLSFFFRHYYPYFKDADDLFSIAGFVVIFIVISTLNWILVFTPYYLWIE